MDTQRSPIDDINLTKPDPNDPSGLGPNPIGPGPVPGPGTPGGPRP